MPQQHHTDVLILGSGAAGCTAAIYAARANMKPIMIEGLQPGGQLTITTDVENYPGFAGPVQGPWLMDQMREQAKHVGTRIFGDIIVKADLSKRPFVCTGDSGDEYTGKTLVIATGATARWLDLPSEKKFQGFGVSACATCDGPLFRNKEVVVVGGGNSAVEESLHLAHLASKVTLVHRRDSLRAEKIGQHRLFSNSKIHVIWDTVLEDYLGSDNPPSVTGVRLKNIKTGKTHDMKTDGVFIAIGHTPNTDLFKGVVGMDKEGYLVTAPGTVKTNVPGVFAAGDVQDRIYRQAVTAAGTGCMAALDAERFLAEHK